MKVGTAEPILPKTLPNLTTLDLKFFELYIRQIISDILFVIPKILVGFTALSVLIAITFFIFLAIDAFMILDDPITFVFTASNGCNSTVGTCFKAAA